MRKMALLFVLVVCVVADGVETVLALDYTLEEYCQNMPQNIMHWDDATKTCTQQTPWSTSFGNFHMTIQAATTWVIASGAGVLFESSMTVIDNYGVIRNDGSLWSFDDFQNHGTFHNTGTMINDTGANMYNYPGGTINNSGTISNNALFINWGALFTCWGVINGTVDNYGTGAIFDQCVYLPSVER